MAGEHPVFRVDSVVLLVDVAPLLHWNGAIWIGAAPSQTNEDDPAGAATSYSAVVHHLGKVHRASVAVCAGVVVARKDCSAVPAIPGLAVLLVRRILVVDETNRPAFGASFDFDT